MRFVLQYTCSTIINKMCKPGVILFPLMLLFSLSSAYKLLVVFPYPGKSHSILGEGYVRLLVKAGHEVTYITPILIKNPPSNLRQIDVSSNLDNFELDKLLNFEKLINKELDLRDLHLMFSAMQTIANTSITHKNVKNLIMDTNEEFDVVIAEWLYTELYSGFATVFNCPLIWSSSLEPHSMVLSLIDELPNPAYIPDHSSAAQPPFTFWERVFELWNIVHWKYVKWLMLDKDDIIFKNGYGPAVAKRGRTLPSLDEVKYNASLMLGNAHVSSGIAIRLPQNHISISGYHISEEVAPLPEDLQKIMDSAPNGVIYFSMGTMMKSKTMPKKLKQDLLKMFSELKQAVIWKLEENLTDVPKNVHLVEWAPQQSILAHSKCLLFITHGGLLSTTETLHFGVPIIGIPLFADQFTNVRRAVIKGFAKQLDINYDTPNNLKIAIEEVLSNARYQEKIKELSFIYHDRPVPPGKEVVHWVEHVVHTRGAWHLRSPALLVPWYQKMYLDLLAVILAILIIIIKVIKIIKNSFTSTRRKQDLKKKRS